MSISFYFDEMMNRPLAEGLAAQGYSVVMANDIGMTGKPDAEHLAEAAKRGMVLVTLDRPFAGTHHNTKRPRRADLLDGRRAKYSRDAEITNRVCETAHG